MAITDYPDAIKGIPDPTKYGDPGTLPLGQPIPLGIQLHEARKAGIHRDVRIGRGEMFSWATKKPGFPLPGEMQGMYNTPIHSQEYGMNFEGELPKGMYGAGKVTMQEKGSVIVHSASPDKIVFTTGHTRYPQSYVMIRTGKKPTDWLIKNLTPKSLEEFAGPGVDFAKEHYKSVPSANVSELYGTGNTFSEKIDGARVLIKLRQHAVDAASYRQSVTGYPIMHTQRLQLPRDLDIPPGLVGSTLVGEAFGERVPGIKVGAYHGARLAKKQLDQARKLGKAPVAKEPSNHTGPDASSRQTGSFMARVIQMGKAGSLEEGGSLAAMILRETAEAAPKMLNRLLEKKDEQQQPPKPILPELPKIEHEKSPAAFSAPGEKWAESAGRVEPQVAKQQLVQVTDTQPKKKKTLPIDSRAQLNDKLAEDAQSIPVQELSGILNSSLAESLRKQKDQGVNMRVALFNVLSQGKKPVGQDVPYSKKVSILQEIMKHLPADKFMLPEMATTPEAQQAMWESIQAGKNPRTREGIVAFPETGAPYKVKVLPEADVILRRMFGGQGKYKDKGVGGFGYSLPGSDKEVGEVGSGLTDELRQAMLEHPDEYLERTARIRSQGQYPSGAHRAPSLIAMHEDYPSKSAMAIPMNRRAYWTGRVIAHARRYGVSIPAALNQVIKDRKDHSMIATLVRDRQAGIAEAEAAAEAAAAAAKRLSAKADVVVPRSEQGTLGPWNGNPNANGG